MNKINITLITLFCFFILENKANADIGISGIISYSNHNYTVVELDSLPGTGATMHTSVTIQNFSPLIPANSVYVFIRYPNSQFLKPDSIVSVPSGWELSDSSVLGNETSLRFTNTSAISELETYNFEIRVIAETESLGAFNAVTAQMDYISGIGSDWIIFPSAITGLTETASIGDEPLPVKWFSFDVAQQNESVILNWSTISENNSLGFFVEKSINGNIWNEIGFVNSNVNEVWKNIKTNYTYIDNNPSEGVNLYRLKQVNYDGLFSYSWIRKVTFTKSGFASQIYPNPAKEKINISARNANYVIVTDVKGTLVKDIKLTNYTTDTIEIDLSDLSIGIYTIRVICDNDVYTHQLTIIK